MWEHNCVESQVRGETIAQTVSEAKEIAQVERARFSTAGVTTNVGYAYYAYTYDSQQRLTKVTQSVGGAAATVTLKCGYRCDGLRAWKENGAGVRTYFLYDGSQLVGEFDTNGAAQATQTWGAEGLAYRRQITGTPATKFYSWDARGNIAATTDATGAIVNTPLPTSDAFNSSGGVEPCATFGGQVGGYRDAETGLVLFGQRYYDGFLGQWISRDPIGESGGVNLYSYVGGNPVNRLDPSGLDWLDNASNFSAGAGDILSLGGTVLVRKRMGTDVVVNTASGAYASGIVAGGVVQYGLLRGVGSGALQASAVARGAQAASAIDRGIVAGRTTAIAIAKNPKVQQVAKDALLGAATNGGMDLAKQSALFIRGKGFDGRSVIRSTAVGAMSGVVGGAAGRGLLVKSGLNAGSASAIGAVGGSFAAGFADGATAANNRGCP